MPGKLSQKHILTSENNVLSARAKRSPLHHRTESKMFLDFIGVYIRNGTLLIRCAHSQNIVQHLKRHFVSPRGHVISSVYSTLNKITQF